ncbi:hypothetical protein TH63_02620 [Rufibacter radiotolerans]|uniref:Uncharacterized protein n=1 Tax=Rufibacter radiotolerans TaxID=1379910 RepID=A0A0H4VGN2_9BACT|nr:hypothetical protein TH63_02620 [Rufibacter radiotolerans]
MLRKRFSLRRKTNQTDVLKKQVLVKGEAEYKNSRGSPHYFCRGNECCNKAFLPKAEANLGKDDNKYKQNK